MTGSVHPIVYIVDDDPGIRDSLRFLLEEAEYEVQEARDGWEALEFLHTDGPPCVLLLDRMMSRLDGIQTLRQLVAKSDQIKRHTAVLFMTARSDPPEPDIAAFVEQHTFATVSKPFNLDTLIALVGKASKQLAEHGAHP